MSFIKAAFSLVMTNKGKLFFALISTLVFLFILFPFDDLSDLVSTQVSKATGNSLYLQFQKLKMSLFPTPGLKMEKVFIQASQVPSINMESLTITPSLSGLIYKKPYGQVSIHGVMKGDLELSLSKGPRTEGGAEREKIEIHGQKLALKDLKELTSLPFQMKGQLQFSTSALADSTWKEQPEAEMDLTINQFELPPASVATPLGPLNLPEFRLGHILMKGRLSGGNFNIEKGTLGKETDEIHGTVKGSIGLTLENRPPAAMPVPIFGSYNFDIEFTVKKSFQDRASAFLIFIDTYKSTVPQGAVYRFKISGVNFMAPPTIGALR
ncbi:MAG: type II secretion system protein GspN [Bdellovibrionaceae bacterium]|nr:type II secretion system protein GspN [Pseudobdellovibrionaceae bacterium]